MTRKGAATAVDFELVEPEGLGAAKELEVTPPQLTAAHDMTVAFIYDSPQYGSVIVKEHRPDVDPQKYDEGNKELLALNGDSQTYGSFKLVTVREKYDAMLTTSGDGSENTLWWLENGVEFIILGKTTTAEDLIEIANGL